MLLDLDIVDLGVIKQAHLPLSPAFTVLTGETGAGKTMVLNALGLLMGAKTDPKLIRSGAEKLAIEGNWDTTNWPQAQELVTGVGGEIDDDGTVISTRLVTTGRSKAYLGGRAVPQGTLTQFTRNLVTVHGQSDQIRLRTPSRQREALDAYGTPQHHTLLLQYQDLWERRAGLLVRFSQLHADATERSREAELLRLSLTEVERIAPQAGEHGELTALIGRLSNTEALRGAVAGAYEALAGEREDGAGTNVASLVDAARRELVEVVDSDPLLAPLAERAAEVGYLVADLASELSSYLAGLEADPGLLEQAQSRLGELNGLARTLHMSADEVVLWADSAGLRLLELDNDDEAIAELQRQISECDSEILALAAELTAERTIAAGELERVVTNELAGLGMKDAELRITVTLTDLGPTGQDQIEFLLIPHIGAPPTPISRGASGGELSRVMLALELALATAAQHTDAAVPLPTFVFDEIDAGVGGRAAVEVGRRLARLAQQAQVIVVTHLPQVAAFADQHLVVQKSAGETGVLSVSGAAREREIARMLSGNDNSETALSHARELLSTAKTQLTA